MDAPATPGVRVVNFTGFEVISAHDARDLGHYPDLIFMAVRDHWLRRISKGDIAGRKPGVEIVEATLKKDGSIEQIKTIQPSGEAALDEAGTSAVSEPAPFARFPAEFHDKQLRLRFHFGYNQPASVPACGELPEVTRQPALPPGHGPISSPSPSYAPDPDYGNEARRAKYQSVVVLGGVVDTDGSFRDLCVKQAAGQGLDEKAIEAASRWKFKPAARGGEPVAVYIEMEVAFRLY